MQRDPDRTTWSEDRKRVEHMIRCADDARAIVATLPETSAPQSPESDMVRTRALVNCFTELGEAAARLTPAARERVGDAPWRQIVGMRNIVVHVYWGIDLAQLVQTTKADLPAFVDQLRTALSTWPDSAR